ncbi:MAG: hypothetical protein AAF744_02300 [Pseudomonadota bacterium]
MSAPDTNVDKQRIRHAPALLGIKGVMLFGAAMLVAIVGYALLDSETSGATAYDPAAAAATTD